MACRAGSAACVRELLGAGADGGTLSTKGNSPLAVAAKHARWDVAAALLDAGVRADGLSLLQAVRKGAPPHLQQRLAIDAGGIHAVDAPEAGGRSALMAAAAAGEQASVKRLLELGADADLRDANGASALHYCADKGSVPCARLLLEGGLEGGGDLAAVDAHGNTPLHAAGRRGHSSLFAALVEAGADAEAVNDRGRPPKLLSKAEADAACAVM